MEVHLKITIDTSDRLAALLSQLAGSRASFNADPRKESEALAPVMKHEPIAKTADEPKDKPDAAKPEEPKRGRGRPRKEEPKAEEPKAEEPKVEEPKASAGAVVSFPTKPEQAGPAEASKNEALSKSVWALAKMVTGAGKEYSAAVRDLLGVIGVERISSVPDHRLSAFNDALNLLYDGESIPSVIENFKKEVLA